MKVLFVIHQLDFADHMAVAYLSAIAKEQGHTTYFCCLKDSDLVLAVKQIRPDVVAYSVNIVGFTGILEAHKRAAKAHKFISIMGGPQPTFFPESFPESGMDAYCVGEGEYAFRDFLNKVGNSEPFDNVDNLITLKKNNPVRPLISNLDELPKADRDLILSSSYLKNVFKKTFYTTRGCPFECAYCCNSYYRQLYSGKGPIVRRFSVERIIQEIEDVKGKYRTDFIKFGDDLFALKADAWLREFVEKYAQRLNIPFNCYLRFDTIDDELLKLLKQAGCYSVHLSVDSTSRHVRDNILKRRMRNVDIVAQLRKIRKYGINTWVNYMLAVPDSSLNDDLETIKLSKDADVTYAAYSTTVPMEKTELYDYCFARKILDPSMHKGDMEGCKERSSLTCFSNKDKDIRYNIYLLGALIAKLPKYLYGFVFLLIKIIPPNIVFKRLRESFYKYNIENKIFKITKGV